MKMTGYGLSRWSKTSAGSLLAEQRRPRRSDELIADVDEFVVSHGTSTRRSARSASWSTKWMVIYQTRFMVKCGGKSIRVNVWVPGATMPPATKTVGAQVDDPDHHRADAGLHARARGHEPGSRASSPSDDSSNVHGQT